MTSTLKKQMAQNSLSVVLVVQLETQLVENEDGSFRLYGKTLKDRKVDENIPLCPNILHAEKFSAFSQGSGFFVDHNIIATAAHVLLDANNYKHTNCSDIRFIIDHRDPMTEDSYLAIPRKNIFRPKKGNEELTYYDFSTRNSDWALMAVEHIDASDTSEENGKESISTQIPFLEIEDDIVEIGLEISCLGHALGLPANFSIGQVVRLNSNFFECDLPAFAGGSGSAIINLSTNKVCGILMRGNHQLQLIQEGKEECLGIAWPSSYSNGKEIQEGQECQDIAPVLKALSSLRTELKAAQEDIAGLKGSY